MKKFIWALIASLILLTVSADSPAQGAELKSRIAVIDTGIDMTNNSVSNKIAYEVCILDFALCPNGKKTMEGSGAATLDPVRAASNGFYHGTQMASVIIKYNPNVEIVFIRVVAMTNAGYKGSVSPNNIGVALEWVKNNAQKYNIRAVSTSMGMPNKTTSCASNTLVENSIVSLKDKGIPSVFSNGNGYSYDRVDFPACFSPSIAVGGADYISNKYYPSLYSNNSTATDFYAYGKLIDAAAPNNTTGVVVGSSVSAALIASKWVLLSDKGLSYSQVYDTIKANTITVSTKNVKDAFIFNHELVK